MAMLVYRRVVEKKTKTTAFQFSVYRDAVCLLVTVSFNGISSQLPQIHFSSIHRKPKDWLMWIDADVTGSSILCPPPEKDVIRF